MITIIQKNGSTALSFSLNKETGQVEETRSTLDPNSALFELSPTDGDLSYDYDTARPVVFSIDERGYLVTESNVRAIISSLQYSGTFMEIPMLTVTIKSPALIAFAIGDYIVWDYDGLTYTLKELPPVSKQSTTNTYGEAFVYEGVKFVSALAEIKYLEFLDVVPSTDETSHFSSLPTFSFYGNVFALIDRLNANLGRLYANWIVEAADVESGDIYDALYTDRDVTIDAPIKVRDALALVYSMWGLGFVYHYDTVTAKHTITIGEYGADTGGFSYGQGNGLYMVGKTITKEDSIVTRLRAYGSTRNMPARYYNNKAILIDRLLLPDPMLYLPNLMIPYTKWQYTGGYPDPELAYINCNSADVDAADTSYAKYGIREQSVYFDGTNNNKEIYPTIEGITSDEMRDAVSGYSGAQLEFYISPNVTGYPDGTRLDKIRVIDSTTDDGTIKTDSTYSETVVFLGDTGEVVMTDRNMTKTFSGIYSATLDNAGEYKVTFTAQSLSAVCTDAPISFGALRIWIVKDGNRSALAATITGVAITNGLEFALPELVLTTQEPLSTFSIEMDLEVELSDLDFGQVATVTWTRAAGGITYELTKTVPNNTFTVELKQIGFDIFRFLPSAGQIPIISMTSGSCAARQFNITKTTYLSATDSWLLTCVRQKDTSINQLFPNSNFHIAAEDSFVLLNINMPDILIDIAEGRLYLEGCKWLKKRKEQQYIYEPKIDEVYMAILAAAGTPEIIKEGMMMPLTDADLGLTGTILINSLTVTESEDSVRKFEVVLREDTDTDLLKYLNAQAKQVSSSAVSGITNATTTTTEPAAQTTTVTSLGFTPENIANKTSVISVDSTATQYPNAKAVYDKVAGFVPYIGVEYDLDLGAKSITTTGSVGAATAKLTNLTDSYIPYHISDASGLANSPLWTDGTKVAIGNGYSGADRNGNLKAFIGRTGGTASLAAFNGFALLEANDQRVGMEFGIMGTNPYASWLQAKDTDNNGGTFPISLQPAGGNVDVGYGGTKSNKFAVNGDVLATQYKLSALNTAPSSASDTGTAGEIRFTTTGIYICIATNTWIKAVASTWT